MTTEAQGKIILKKLNTEKRKILKNIKKAKSREEIDVLKCTLAAIYEMIVTTKNSIILSHYQNKITIQ